MSSGEGLCYTCTSDTYLSPRIRKTGSRLKCVGCGKRWRKCIPIEELGGEVRAILERYYQRTEDSDDGDNLNWIIQEIVELDGPDVDGPKAADRLLRYVLPDEGEVFATIKDGGDVFLDEHAGYEPAPVYAGEFRYTWDSFCFNVKHSARFFSSAAESRLRELLQGVERYKTQDGKSCIRTIAPNSAEAILYRARRAFDQGSQLRIVDSPAREMGPPPGLVAPSGRMNPVGVSVFYGAFEDKTCLAEIRVPVGGTAFTAAFRLIRPITVLDLTVLDQGFHGVSMFDPLYSHVSEQSAFLEGFHDEISRPVLEHEEELEFIPTQVVAEYLANKFDPPLDGVIYKSPQAGGEALNIALFRRSSGVKEAPPLAQSGSIVYVDPEDRELVIRNPPKPRPPKDKSPIPMDILSVAEELTMSDPSTHPDIVVEPTLEFVQDSLKFWKVLSTTQNAEQFRIDDTRPFDKEMEEKEERGETFPF